MEFEQAGVLAVENVVEACEVGAESFGESLSRELGEIAESVESPEVENFEIAERKAAAFDQFVQREGVRTKVIGQVSGTGGGSGRERGEVGEIGGGPEGGLYGEG